MSTSFPHGARRHASTFALELLAEERSTSLIDLWFARIYQIGWRDLPDANAAEWALLHLAEHLLELRDEEVCVPVGKERMHRLSSRSGAIDHVETIAPWIGRTTWRPTIARSGCTSRSRSWVGEKRIEECLSALELGNLSMTEKAVAYRSVLIVGGIKHCRKHQRAEARIPILTLITYLSDNAKGTCFLSISKMQELFDRSRQCIVDNIWRWRRTALSASPASTACRTAIGHASPPSWSR